MSELILEKETYEILGACFEVYRDKGHGFLEPVYPECMEIELALRHVPFTSQTSLPLNYKGVALKQTYRADLLCFGKVLVELKAVSHLIDEHRSQVLNYLRATGLSVGLLVNFGHHPRIEHERFVITR